MGHSEHKAHLERSPCKRTRIKNREQIGEYHEYRFQRDQEKRIASAEQIERQSMRPGITGWEAVHEGESNNRREMAMFDLYYVRNWSLKLDWLVFYKTFAIVLGFQRPDDSVRAPKMTDDQIVEGSGHEYHESFDKTQNK